MNPRKTKKAEEIKESKDYYLPDSRPTKHDDSELATDEVLHDMAVEDALDGMGW